MKSPSMPWVNPASHFVSATVSNILSLVVESGARRKKSKGGSGVFKFAKTIEEGVWEDEEQKKAIQVCSSVTVSETI